MDKIKLNLDALTHDLLAWTLATLRTPGYLIPSMEVESLVLLEFERRNIEKLTLQKPPMKIALRKYEAISLYRVLFAVNIEDEIGDVCRNALCNALKTQLPLQIAQN